MSYLSSFLSIDISLDIFNCPSLPLSPHRKGYSRLFWKLSSEDHSWAMDYQRRRFLVAMMKLENRTNIIDCKLDKSKLRLGAMVNIFTCSYHKPRSHKYSNSCSYCKQFMQVFFYIKNIHD